MAKLHAACVLLAAFVAAGCGGEEPGVFGLRVEVRDARTGAPLAYDAMLVVSDGLRADTVRGWELYGGLDRAAQTHLPALFQRAGSYDVEVTHPDYRTWSRAGVEVGMSGAPGPMDGKELVRTSTLVAELELQ
jgi:hypothetical protein